MSAGQAQRALGLMSFANVLDIPEYVRLLRENGCEVRLAEDTGRLAGFFDLALNMSETQFTYDLLATLQFQTELLKVITDNFHFLLDLCRAGKMIKPVSWPDGHRISPVRIFNAHSEQ